MKPSGRRRGFKSWFVEPYRQVKLGILFLLLNMAFAGLMFGIFGYYVWDIYQTLAALFKLTSDQSAELLEKFQFPIIAGAVLIFVFIVASIMIAVRYTHRIYGPLVSIHRFIDDYLQGAKVSPLNLRESDQLKELAEKLNQLVDVQPNDRRAPNMRPIYQYIDDLLKGADPEPIRVREADAMQGLIERLNRLGDMIKGRTTG